MNDAEGGGQMRPVCARVLGSRQREQPGALWFPAREWEPGTG